MKRFFFTFVFLLWRLSNDTLYCNAADIFTLNRHLSDAAACGDVEEVIELLSHGADVNYDDQLCVPALIQAVINGHFKIACLLLAQDANTELTTRKEGFGSRGWTALHYAANNGDCDFISLLLEHKANVNAPAGSIGFTPLLLAATMGHYDAAKLLLQNNAATDSERPNRLTPLHRAAEAGHWDIVELLLNSWANGCATDAYMNTPLDYCANGMRTATDSKKRMLYTTILVLLQNQSAGSYAHKGLQWLDVHFSAYKGENSVFFTHARKLNVNAKDILGATPLFYAAFNGHAKIVRMLLRMGGKVDARDMFDQPPIFYAVWNGHYDAARALMEHGADIDVRNENGDTLLHDAVRRGDLARVEGLLALGASIAATDQRGRTPHMIAIENEDSDAMFFLLRTMFDRQSEMELQSTISHGTSERDVGSYKRICRHAC